jgi:hypothetical protein
MPKWRGAKSLVLYVYKNGSIVYTETITGLTSSWQSKSIDFGGTEDFVSNATTTYDFEIIGFNPLDGCSVWEIDNIKLNGCCGSSVSKPVINVSSAQICKGESVTLSAENCTGGNILWSTGATSSTITVTPQTTISYTVTCSLGACSTQESVSVTVDPNCINNICLTCDPKTVVEWTLDQCLALTEAYNYSEFTPTYPNSANFVSTVASNVFRDNPSSNFHSCTVGKSGRAMCISAGTGSSADWSKAVKFSVKLKPSQVGDLSKLIFRQKADDVLRYAPEPSSSGGTANNNYPTKYAVRVYKGSSLVFESLNNSTNPKNWTDETIDFSNDPDFKFSTETTFKFELVAYHPVGNGYQNSVWDLDNIKVIACNKSEEISVTATYSSPECTGSNVTLSATSSTSGLTYSWSGPVGFGTVQVATATTQIPGVYTVTATVSNGCTATATTEVVVSNCGSIGSTVWIDINNNGIIDAGEEGIANVTVSLFDDSNNLITTDITDGNGNYFFDGLAPGQYQVKILGANLPADYQFVSEVTINTEEVDGNNNGSQVDGGADIISQIVVLEPNGEPFGADELLGNADNQIGGAQDDAKDKYGDMTVDFGLIANPKIDITKKVVSVTPTGNNQYTVKYEIDVINSGVAKGSYSLSDTPGFDDDIIINSASFTSNVPSIPGGNLTGTGPWNLASNVNLAGGTTHTYEITTTLTINLVDAVGDNTYTKCGESSITPKSGEGLYNEAEITLKNNVKKKAIACDDIPYIVHEKTLSETVDLGNNLHQVTYQIVVKNIGGIAGTYSLQDDASFEDDIEIIDGSYNSVEIGVYAFSGDPGVLDIVSDYSINPGETDTYFVSYKVKIDLSEGSSGDNEYKACGTTIGTTEFTAGEGLFNESILKDSEGIVIAKDTACGDLPSITHTKTLSLTNPLGDNKYEITYDIVVTNNGGIDGTYGLKDDPSFDDDIEILDVTYSTTSGVPTVSLNPSDNVWNLASNVSLAAGASHTYSIKVTTEIDLSSGSSGDNVYNACGSKTGGTEFEVGEGLFNESLLTDLNGATIERDTACGDLPYIVHAKVVSNRTQIDRDEYTIEYRIDVENIDGVPGIYGLNDQPGFDDDIEVTSVS